MDLECVMQDHIRWKETLKHLCIFNERIGRRPESNHQTESKIHEPKSPKLSSSGRKLRIKGFTPSTTTFTSTGLLYLKNYNFIDDKWSSQSFQKDGSIVIPLSKELETADFALSSTCGPVVTHIRCLDSIYVSRLQK